MTTEGPVLELTAAQIAALRMQAETAYPQECCGLLTGVRVQDRYRIQGLVAAPNIHHEPRHHFELDPSTHFATLRKLRADGNVADVLGHYHSHPDSAAAPSAQDLAQVFDATLIWVVIASGADGAGSPTAWRPRHIEDAVVGFDPVRIEILPEIP